MHLIKVVLKLVSMRSNGTFKLGCLVTKGYIPRSVGYNYTRNGVCTHAEVSALQKLTPHTRQGSIVYCSWSPCADCEQYMRDNKIKHVYYSWVYPGNIPPDFSSKL